MKKRAAQESQKERLENMLYEKPVGYEIARDSRGYYAVLITEMKDGTRKTGAVVIARARTEEALHRRARNEVAGALQRWKAEHDYTPRKVIMYSTKPPKPPVGPSGVSGARRMRS